MVLGLLSAVLHEIKATFPLDISGRQHIIRHGGPAQGWLTLLERLQVLDGLGMAVQILFRFVEVFNGILDKLFIHVRVRLGVRAEQEV